MSAVLAEILQLFPGVLGTLTIFGTSGAVALGILALLLPICAFSHWTAETVETLSQSLTAFPALASLFLFYYAVQPAINIQIGAWGTTVLVVGCYSGLAVTSLLVGRIREASHRYAPVVSGLHMLSSFVVQKQYFPDALAGSLSGLISISVSTLHLTMFGSLLGADELFRSAQRLNAESMRPVEVFTAMGLLYFVLCVPLVLLAKRLRARGR